MQIRRLHVIRGEGAGKGDCGNCPAHSFDCAREEWDSQMHTLGAVRSEIMSGPDAT